VGIVLIIKSDRIIIERKTIKNKSRVQSNNDKVVGQMGNNPD